MAPIYTAGPPTRGKPSGLIGTVETRGGSLEICGQFVVYRPTCPEAAWRNDRRGVVYGPGAR